jgi:hypothetical protein
MEGLTRRYPSQDQGESIAEYFKDYEQLVLKYSLHRVKEAVDALRISRDQKFFPKPDEVDEEIERQRQSRQLDAMVKATADYLASMEEARREHVEFMESGLI